MKATYRIPMRHRGEDGKLTWQPVGFEVDSPDAHWLVKMGVATPSDDECRDACEGYTEEVLQRLQESYQKLQRGQLTGDKRYDSDTGSNSSTDTATLSDSDN